MRYLSIPLLILLVLFSFIYITNANEARVKSATSDNRTMHESSAPHVIRPCASSPNCVSSTDENPKRNIAPYRLKASADDAWKELKAFIQLMPRTSIIEEDGFYLHVEAKSSVFGFTDDVQFVLIMEEGLIHVRSSSRTGYWDLGVNKRRINRIGEHLRSAGVIY